VALALAVLSHGKALRAETQKVCSRAEKFSSGRIGSKVPVNDYGCEAEEVDHAGVAATQSSEGVGGSGGMVFSLPGLQWKTVDHAEFFSGKMQVTLQDMKEGMEYSRDVLV
ncbi:unnamed protein product, partial [Durusdinium trenchii]